MKKSYEITLVGNSGIGYWPLMSRSLQSSTRPFAGFSIALYFPCPPVPIAFSLLFLNVQCGIKKHGHIGVSLFVLCRSIPFLPRDDVWDFPRGRLFLANHIHVYPTTERPPRRSRLSQNRLVHCYIHYGCSDGLFLFTALFVCAFFVRDRTSTTMHGTSRSSSRCRTFGVTTHSKLIRMSVPR